MDLQKNFAIITALTIAGAALSALQSWRTMTPPFPFEPTAAVEAAPTRTAAATIEIGFVGAAECVASAHVAAPGAPDLLARAESCDRGRRPPR